MNATVSTTAPAALSPLTLPPPAPAPSVRLDAEATAALRAALHRRRAASTGSRVVSQSGPNGLILTFATDPKTPWRTTLAAAVEVVAAARAFDPSVRLVDCRFEPTSPVHASDPPS